MDQPDTRISGIISIKEARKLLGKQYEHMTDTEVEKLVNDLSHLAQLALEDARNKLLKKESLNRSADLSTHS